MKHLILQLALCLLLCGCTPAGPDLQTVRDRYGALEELELEASVTTVGEVSLEFSLRFQRTGGCDTVTILEPVGLGGITATLTEGSTAIAYQGAVAETLLPGVPGFAPCDALTGLLGDLSSATPASAAPWNTEEGEGLKLVYQAGDGEKQVWLGSDLALRRAELYRSGSLMLRLEVR